jgi:hypothetical protein
VLAVPLLLGALGIAISGWFSNDGPYVADPAASSPPLTAFTPREQEDIRDRIRTKKLESITNLKIDTGPARIFALYPTRSGQTAAKETYDNIVTSIAAFERQRGAVLSALEQPVLIGDVFVQETEGAKFPYLRWTHLKRGFDWERMAWAGGVAAFAVLIYLIARALGWVIDGFVSRTES